MATPLQTWDDAFNTDPETYRLRGLLNTLRKYADNTTLECWPSIGRLQQDTGLSRNGVQKLLTLAIESGWLVRLRIGSNTNGKNISSKYRLKQPHEVIDTVTTYKPTETAEPIPSSWHINGIHVNECDALGLRANALGSLFKAWAVGENKRSHDWDKKFGAFIALFHDDDLNLYTFEDKGYYSLENYLPDDADTEEWWHEYALDN